jgi:hypothetical protein
VNFDLARILTNDKKRPINISNKVNQFIVEILKSKIRIGYGIGNKNK